MILHILEYDTANALNYTLAHKSTSEFEVRSIKSNYATICKFESTWSTESRNNSIATHWADEFVVAVHFVGVVGSLEKVVGNRRMVGRVFAVVATAIGKTSLVRLSEERVERLVLSSANVVARHLGNYDPL